jgi:hypothetical protein
MWVSRNLAAIVATLDHLLRADTVRSNFAAETFGGCGNARGSREDDLVAGARNQHYHFWRPAA